MDRARRQRCFVVDVMVPIGARGGLGHSPTSRHHCFKVTATLETFTPVFLSAVPMEHRSLSSGILRSFRLSSIYFRARAFPEPILIIFGLECSWGDTSKQYRPSEQLKGAVFGQMSHGMASKHDPPALKLLPGRFPPPALFVADGRRIRSSFNIKFNVRGTN